ncbi:MAG: DUF4230 domain-containing protein [Candidatus Levyibacteriota bacterium]
MNRKKVFLGGAILCLIVFVVVIFVTKWTLNQQKDTAVIQQIRTLNRWETSSYTIEQVIDNGTSGNVFQRFLFGDRILLIAHGSVTAGFDLANLSNNSIHTNGKDVTITMPAPEIISTSLDESQTRVYDRQKGLLVHSDDNLESQARISAVNKIRQAACSGGILNSASDNAKKQLTPMLQALGFENVTLTIPQGHC